MNVWAQLFSCQQLMPDPFNEAGNLLHGIVDGEGVVAWNSKDLVDTKLGEACQNIFSNGGSFHRNGARMANGMLSYNLELAIPMEGVENRGQSRVLAHFQEI